MLLLLFLLLARLPPSALFLVRPRGRSSSTLSLSADVAGVEWLWACAGRSRRRRRRLDLLHRRPMRATHEPEGRTRATRGCALRLASSGQWSQRRRHPAPGWWRLPVLEVVPGRCLSLLVCRRRVCVWCPVPPPRWGVRFEKAGGWRRTVSADIARTRRPNRTPQHGHQRRAHTRGWGGRRSYSCQFGESTLQAGGAAAAGDAWPIRRPTCCSENDLSAIVSL